MGIPCNVGTPDHLFYPANFRQRLPRDYTRRKLSTQDIADLMHVDRSTVHVWRKKGWLKGRRGARRRGWQKWWYWRHSLKDLEDCLLVMQTRKHHGNPVEHTTWTPQERELVKNGIRPEGRSRLACRIKLCRLRKEKLL
jgi:transposase-like protein